MRKIITALLLLLSTLSCKANEYSTYVGVWQTGDAPPKTVEISKDGNSYLLSDLRATDFSGKKQSPRVLSEAGSQLAVNTGMGTAPLGLSGDKNTLYFDKWAFKRVPKQDADRVNSEIQSAQLERKINQDQCKALGRDFEYKANEIYQSNATAKAKMTRQAELKRDLVANAEKIPDCKRTLLLY